MAKRKTKYQEAVTKFNRAAGQIRRYSDINTSEYLEQAKTVRQVENALKKLKFDYEQEQIGFRVHEYEMKYYTDYREELEKQYIDLQEEAEKDADVEEKLKQYEKGYETFKDLYLTEEEAADFTESDFRELIDVWGGISQEIKDAYGGSDPKKPGSASALVGTYKEIKDPLMKEKFPEMLKEIYEKAPEGSTQEYLIDQVYKMIDRGNAAYDKIQAKKGKKY